MDRENIQNLIENLDSFFYKAKTISWPQIYSDCYLTNEYQWSQRGSVKTLAPLNSYISQCKTKPICENMPYWEDYSVQENIYFNLQ